MEASSFLAVPAPKTLAAFESARDILVREDLVPLACFLLAEHYSDMAIEGAIKFAAKFQTVTCCRWIDEMDREQAEKTLPRAPESVWLRHEWATFEAGTGDPFDDFSVPLVAPVMDGFEIVRVRTEEGCWERQAAPDGDNYPTLELLKASVARNEAAAGYVEIFPSTPKDSDRDSVDGLLAHARGADRSHIVLPF